MLNSGIIVILTNLAVHIPIYLVWLAGIVLSLLTWRRNPRPSLYAILGIVCLFVSDMISLYMTTALIRPGLDRTSYGHIATLMTIESVVMAIMRAISWGLLVAAIFVGRNRQPAPAGSIVI
jgi:hypothetical protein